jgi:hypothetical protein
MEPDLSQDGSLVFAPSFALPCVSRVGTGGGKDADGTLRLQSSERTMACKFKCKDLVDSICMSLSTVREVSVLSFWSHWPDLYIELVSQDRPSLATARPSPRQRFQHVFVCSSHLLLLELDSFFLSGGPSIRSWKSKCCLCGLPS